MIQNARDASVEQGTELSVKYKNGNLILFNKGTTLPHQALLIGFSTKRDRDDLIGQFGEGLKLGTLALLRDKRGVKIRSGDEIWTPSIEPSEAFKTDVLVFNIRKGKDIGGVEVAITDISPEEWSDWKEKFTFLNEDKSQVIAGRDTYLLLDPKHKGSVFVKGVFVTKVESLRYGRQNRSRCAVGRDRSPEKDDKKMNGRGTHP